MKADVVFVEMACLKQQKLTGFRNVKLQLGGGIGRGVFSLPNGSATHVRSERRPNLGVFTRHQTRL